MPTTGTRLVRKSLKQPDETREFEQGKGKLQLVNLDSGPVGLGTFEPGWKWSEHVKPIAKTDSCQAAHMAYTISGRMKITMDDGSSETYSAGDVMVAPPGHDAEVMGNEACVLVDWTGVANYAKG